MNDTPSLGEFTPPVVDYGSGRGQAPRVITNWLKVGPLVVEFHRWWFRLGVCAGLPGYVGLYLGFAVVTVGRRRWVKPLPWYGNLASWVSGTSNVTVSLGVPGTPDA
jgi:hypothetical protein